MAVARSIKCLEGLSTTRVICVIVAVKIALILAAAFLMPKGAGAYYGVGFADNYDRLAWNLAQGRGYRFETDTALTLMREPGYPVVLAGLFSLFGRSLTAARFANVLFSGLAAFLLAGLCRRIFTAPVIASVAVVLFLLNPGVVISDLRGGVESLFILLVVTVVYALTVAVRSNRPVDFVKAGALLGLTSLVRSTALLFPIFLLPYYFFWRPAHGSWIASGARVALVAAAVVVVLSPWMIRNDLVAGVPLPTASVSSVAAHAGQYICIHRTLENKFQQLDLDAADERAQFAQSIGLRFKQGGYYYQNFYDTQDELRFNKALSAKVVDTYRQHPELLVKCPSLNLLNFWFAGKNWTATILNVVVQLPWLILGVLGMVLAIRSGYGRESGLCILFCVYLMGVHLPVHAQARYSIPLIPFLSMFAAFFLTRRLKAFGAWPDAAIQVMAVR